MPARRPTHSRSGHSAKALTRSSQSSGRITPVPQPQCAATAWNGSERPANISEQPCRYSDSDQQTLTGRHHKPNCHRTSTPDDRYAGYLRGEIKVSATPSTSEPANHGHLSGEADPIDADRRDRVQATTLATRSPSDEAAPSAASYSIECCSGDVVTLLFEPMAAWNYYVGGMWGVTSPCAVRSVRKATTAWSGLRGRYQSEFVVIASGASARVNLDHDTAYCM